MSHLDSSMAPYNSLVDPHLQCYFSNERIRSHLKHAGLISRRGEIISDSEYRLKLVRREHKKHVRQVLAENIVHQAIDMERTRQAELKRHLDTIAKAALVHSVKESRRRGGYSSGTVSNSNDMGLLSVHSSWSQIRPKSANHHQDIQIMNEEFGEQPQISRVQSAHVNGDHQKKYLSKSLNRRHRYLNRPKKLSNIQRSSPFQRPRSPTKPSDSSLTTPPCQITMIYYGPHTKIDYDHSLFEPIDEIIVMQQHCGGENLIVYKNNLKAGDEFTFNSRRHADYPFGLSLYVKGLIDSRISTCCEYKHRHGVRLGGERGHFAIVSVQGSKPCLKCRFEHQARLKKYTDSNEKDDKPITISISVSDQSKIKQTPVKIPVRHISDSNENYSEDFDGSDRAEKPQNDYSLDSNKEKNKIQIRSKSPTETSSTTTITLEEKSSTKTWQIIFHTSNIPTGSFQLPKNSSINSLLKFSFISINEKDETEQYEINIKDFSQCFKSGRQDSFPVKLRNIGKPNKIRLLLHLTEYNNEDIKWHLDHIELIDPETQLHYNFPCNQWIYPLQEKILNLSESSRKSSLSSIDKKHSQQPTKISSRSSSSSSSYESPKRFELIEKPIINQIRRISTDNQSIDKKNKIRYRVIIYPSDDHYGEFYALNDSRIFLRLNNQTNNTFIYKKDTKYCPSFESGENQTFDIDFIQDTNEQPTKLTIGYYNSDITAGKWKLQKIVLINTETGEETVFPCKESLIRNDFNLQAEQTFQAQSKQSDDENDQQNTPRNVEIVKRASSRSESEENIQQKQVQLPTNRSSSPESLQQTTIITKKNDEKPPSSRSSENLNDDNEDNEYNRMFKNKNQQQLDSSSSRPKTRRGRQDTFDIEENSSNKLQTNNDIWKPSNDLDKKEPVDPLIGLDELQDQTARSNEQKNPLIITNNIEDQFKDWYPKTDDDED